MQKLFFFVRVHNFIAKRVKWFYWTQRAKTCADGNTEVGLGFERSGNLGRRKNIVHRHYTL